MSENENIDLVAYTNDQLKEIYGLDSIVALVDNIVDIERVREIPQIDLDKLDKLLSQLIENLLLVFEAQKNLVSIDQIEATLRWSNSRVNII